jgi:uncharacterized cupin superfamily protein
VANVYSPVFDDDTSRYARTGYRCERARLGYQAGCERLGLSLWELATGAEGTSHYHYANEELVVVLAGQPSLLTPAGWRELDEGEIAAFPRGPRGGHALANRTNGAVRVVFFSEMRGPDVVIYPDIGVVAVLEEMSSPERGGLAAWLRLEDALERHNPPDPDLASCPAIAPSRASLLNPQFDTEQDRPGFSWKRARLAHQAGAERLGASLFELPPGQASFPLHYHMANEELLVALVGSPTLRSCESEREVDEGEIVALPVGDRGAHQLLNRSSEAVRFLIVSEMVAPDVVVYPDSEKVGARERAPGSVEDGLRLTFQKGDAVDYFEGEKPPGRDSIDLA